MLLPVSHFCSSGQQRPLDWRPFSVRESGQLAGVFCKDLCDLLFSSTPKPITAQVCQPSGCSAKPTLSPGSWGNADRVGFWASAHCSHIFLSLCVWADLAFTLVYFKKHYQGHQNVSNNSVITQYTSKLTALSIGFLWERQGSWVSMRHEFLASTESANQGLSSQGKGCFENVITDKFWNPSIGLARCSFQTS